MNKIKCGRVTYELEDGDTVMDNGACRQLITRKITRGWNSWSPLVSKAEFSRFKKCEMVEQLISHTYGGKVTLWVYKSK
jgi:hypothetical protein